MKHILIVILLAVSAPSWAYEMYFIDAGTEDITLFKTKCPGGGQKATLMEKRKNGTAAYGCWLKEGENVYVKWVDLLGADGVFRKGGFIMRYDAPSSLLEDSSK